MIATFIPGMRGTTLEVPAPPSLSSTLLGAVKGFTTGGTKGAVKAVTNVLGAVSGIPGLNLVADFIGGAIETKSKANWDRTLGRVRRAADLGFVPEPPIQVIQRLKQIWIEAGDSTGAQFWDRVVAFFSIPTEKGGTKEGFGAGAPLGSKKIDKEPGYGARVTSFVAAVG